MAEMQKELARLRQVEATQVEKRQRAAAKKATKNQAKREAKAAEGGAASDETSGNEHEAKAEVCREPSVVSPSPSKQDGTVGRPLGPPSTKSCIAAPAMIDRSGFAPELRHH